MAKEASCLSQCLSANVLRGDEALQRCLDTPQTELSGSGRSEIEYLAGEDQLLLLAVCCTMAGIIE